MAPTRNSAHIRTARIVDLHEVQAIAHDTYRQHFAHCWSEVGLQTYLQRDFSEAALRLSLNSPEHAWFLMCTDDRTLGYAKVNWARSEAVSGASGAELQKIYFRADAVRHGHGAQLLHHIIHAATQHGEPAVWLNVLKTNESARRFYARHGFDTIGELPYRTDLGDDTGMWTMTRTLG